MNNRSIMNWKPEIVKMLLRYEMQASKHCTYLESGNLEFENQEILNLEIWKSRIWNLETWNLEIWNLKINLEVLKWRWILRMYVCCFIKVPCLSLTSRIHIIAKHLLLVSSRSTQFAVYSSLTSTFVAI